ncbi:MAG: HNH endonuclease signature motif containing protein [Bacteroidaceae bacterium]
MNSPKHGEFRALIDLEDVNKVKDYTWGIMKPYSPRIKCDIFYVQTQNKHISDRLLHRYLMNCPHGMVVDHIDGDSLNNQKSNLRICTKAENNMNRRMYSNNTTGHLGVYDLGDKYVNRWLARIKVGGHGINLKYCFTYEEAVSVREDAEKKYYGEFLRPIEESA